MIYQKFIENEIGHLPLKEWLKVLESLEVVRLAKTPNPHEWIGYTVNTRSSGKQFHDEKARKYDGDLLLDGVWKRVFYWHFIPGAEEEGVITFEGSTGEETIEQSAQKVALQLNAKVEDEETTKYD